MRAQKSCLNSILCLFLGFSVIIFPAQQAQGDFSPEDLSAGANLVITSVSGPTTATLNEKISVTYTVKNQGDAASGAYNVRLYLSPDKAINPAVDHLLGSLSLAEGLAPGGSKKATAKVLVPNYHVNGLSGNYYYGAVVAASKKASSKQVAIVRYSSTDDDETVTDHKTGLIWQRTDDGVNRNWVDAGSYCEGLSLGGKADWRLPRVEELQTLVDYARYNPAMAPMFDGGLYDYWSSSTYAFNPSSAWNVNFFSGRMSLYLKTDPHSCARCVRGGP